GYGPRYPASSKEVIAVGGTTLTKEPESVRGWTETAWNGSGGGCSVYEQKPPWQQDPGCTNRTSNDVAAVGDPEKSPVSVYDSYEYQNEHQGGTGKLGWVLLGGTSVATPIVAGVEAHATAAVRNEGAEAFYRTKLFDI